MEYLTMLNVGLTDIIKQLKISLLIIIKKRYGMEI